MFLLATIYSNNASAQINDNESKMIDLLMNKYADTSPTKIEMLKKKYNIDKTYEANRLLSHLDYDVTGIVKNADEYDRMISCLQHIPELRSIKVSSDYLSQKHIESLAKLKIIALYLSHSSNRVPINLKPFETSKYLKYINLSGVYATDDNLIVLSKAQVLVDIELSHNPKCTTHFIKEYVNAGKSLHFVRFWDVAIDEETFKYLALMKDLKEIEILYCEDVKNEWLEILCYSYATKLEYSGEIDWQLFNDYAFKAYLNRRMLNPTEKIDPIKSSFLFGQYATELDRKFMVRNYGGGK